VTTVLAGRHIVCTRPVGADAALVSLLVAEGALAEAVPVLATSPIAGGVDALDRALGDLPEWAVAFTSATTVEVAEPLLHRLAGRTVGAVGPATARALASHGVVADVVPEAATARALGAALTAARVPGVLGAVAFEPLPDLAATLSAGNVAYSSVALYRTVHLHLDRAARAVVAAADLICVASPSAVQALRANEIDGTVVAIGPTTAAAAAAAHFAVAAVAETPSPHGMVEACRRACFDAGWLSDRA
jgi:uroporphyrinogen-III synthase